MRMKSLTFRYGKNLPSNEQGLDGKIFLLRKVIVYPTNNYLVFKPNHIKVGYDNTR